MAHPARPFFKRLETSPLDMSISVYDQMNAPQMQGIHPVAISRPQVGIERLPTRRLSNEPRESMNCKSCRKRKVVTLSTAAIATSSCLTFPDQMQPIATCLRGVPSLSMPLHIW
jgi:hypothetical protein